MTQSIRPLVLGGLAVLLLIIANSATFILPQGGQALVLQWGAPQRAITEPGLKLKWPLIETVTLYEKRLVEVVPPIQQVILSDQKRVDVDSYSLFRITNSLVFYQTVNNVQTARGRLADIINSAVRRVLGSTPLSAVLSNERERIMTEIGHEVSESAKRFGVDVVDVRLRRVDLPETTSASIFNRMRSEREREAREFRAQGQEQAQQIRSRADRDRTVLLAEANREAQTIRGEGDAQATRLYADAFGRDPEFFAFYRSMQAYRESLGGGDATFVLSPDNGFLRYLDPQRR